MPNKRLGFRAPADLLEEINRVADSWFRGSVSDCIREAVRHGLPLAEQAAREEADQPSPPSPVDPAVLKREIIGEVIELLAEELDKPDVFLSSQQDRQKFAQRLRSRIPAAEE